MYDVWQDPDYEFAESKSERLLLAAWTIPPNVRRLRGGTPTAIDFQTIAARMGRTIIYIPLGQLSPVALKKIRVVHVLDGYDKREIAKDYLCSGTPVRRAGRGAEEKSPACGRERRPRRDPATARRSALACRFRCSKAASGLRSERRNKCPNSSADLVGAPRERSPSDGTYPVKYITEILAASKPLIWCWAPHGQERCDSPGAPPREVGPHKLAKLCRRLPHPRSEQRYARLPRVYPNARLRTLADNVVRFSRNISAAAFLLHPVLCNACSMMLFSMPASVLS
jgi:hypothetical protein